MITRSVTIDNGSSKDEDAGKAGSAMWWNRPLPKEADDSDECEQVHGEVVPYVTGLMATWSMHDWFDRCHDRLYENRTALRSPKAAAALAAVGFSSSRLGVIPSIIDTFRSRFERRRPMPMLVVDDADYTLKQQAGEFQALLRGKMKEKDVDHVSSGVLLDTGVRGTGVSYVDEDDEDIIVEKVHRWELFVDPHEARGGESAVRQIHRVRRMAREVLLARFPGHRAAIEAANPSAPRMHEASDDMTAPASGSSPGLVDVYESWHIPSAAWCEDDDEDADDYCDDGRKSVCIEGATLYFGRWTRPRFPFAILRRYDRPQGFWGQGTAERLADAAHDINRTIASIQQNADVNSNLIVFTPEAMDGTPTEKLTGRGPMRIRFRGAQPPMFKVPDAVSPSQLGYLEKRIAWAHDFEGVAQWSAQGRSPLGAGASGVAIDTMEDLQSDRHATFEAAYSRWRCEVAQLILDACRAVAKRMKARRKAEGGKRRKFGAVWSEHGTLRRLEWDSVALDDEQYRIEIEPVSFVPTTRAGKLAATKELSGLGIWSPEQMMELFDEPDLASASRQALAKLKNARRVMSLLGNPKEEAPMPEPQWGLEMHAKMAVDYYCLALCDGAPEEVQARYRDYADACNDELERGKAPPVNVDAPADPAAMQPPGMPPGVPMDPAMAGALPPAMPPEMGPPMPEMPMPIPVA